MSNRARSYRIALAATCVLLLIALGGFISSRRAQGTRTRTAPSESRESSPTPATAGPVTEPTMPASAPTGSCRNIDLSASVVSSDPLGGNTKVEIRFRNVGITKCSLTGRPGIVAIDGAGNETSVRSVEQTYFGAPPPAPASLAVGDEEGFYLSGSTACADFAAGKRVTLKALDVKLPSGDLVEIGLEEDATCGLSSTPFGIADPEPTPYVYESIGTDVPGLLPLPSVPAMAAPKGG